MLLAEEQEILKLLNEYVVNGISNNGFVKDYAHLLSKLEEKLDDGLYHPLNIIIATENNSERAWKEDMRNMYLREIKNLDELLEIDEPSYSENLTEEGRKKLCLEAIEAIPRLALDRFTKEWVEKNLVIDQEFCFSEKDGKPRFETSTTLYTSNLERMSFIATAFAGNLPKLEFDYSNLIDALKKKTDVDTIWVRCSDSDGYAAVSSAPAYTNPRDEIDNLAWLEYTDPQETQWGACHLLFMPSHREWLLVHSNDFNNFTMSLYGQAEFVRSILGELNFASQA